MFAQSCHGHHAQCLKEYNIMKKLQSIQAEQARYPDFD